MFYCSIVTNQLFILVNFKCQCVHKPYATSTYLPWLSNELIAWWTHGVNGRIARSYPRLGHGKEIWLSLLHILVDAHGLVAGWPDIEMHGLHQAPVRCGLDLWVAVNSLQVVVVIWSVRLDPLLAAPPGPVIRVLCRYDWRTVYQFRLHHPSAGRGSRGSPWCAAEHCADSALFMQPSTHPSPGWVSSGGAKVSKPQVSLSWQLRGYYYPTQVEQFCHCEAWNNHVVILANVV